MKVKTLVSLVFGRERWRSAIVERFQRPELVAEYEKRATYPPEVDDILLALAGDEPGVILDLGSGPGTLARRLASRSKRVDALDFSIAMLVAGRSMSRADNRRIRWICGSGDDLPLRGRYNLIVAGTSLHWMHAERVMPRCRELLHDGGLLAIVNVSRSSAWHRNERWLLMRHATVFGHLPANIVRDLTRRRLIHRIGEAETAETTVTQRVDDYINAFHSREGFCRADLGSGRVEAFHRDLHRLLDRHADDRGELQFTVRGRVVWGIPA